MTRGYAIALGAGTQTLTMLPWVVIFGPIGAADELPRTVLMTAAWVINLAVAEYVIRRRVQRSNRRSTTAGLAPVPLAALLRHRMPSPGLCRSQYSNKGQAIVAKASQSCL